MDKQARMAPTTMPVLSVSAAATQEDLSKSVVFSRSRLSTRAGTYASLSNLHNSAVHARPPQHAAVPHAAPTREMHVPVPAWMLLGLGT